MVFTTRLSQGKKGAGTRNGFETELRRLNVVQKNGRPNHPTTQGKVERFQQTMKKWLRRQPEQPSTIDDLQALLDAFVEEYNDHRPHRSLDHRATPATVYTTRPKATPSTGDRDDDTHDRVRYDKVDKAGKITWRYQRPDVLHRHRPNPHRNPRHRPVPGPRHPRSSTPPPANCSAS